MKLKDLCIIGFFLGPLFFRGLYFDRDLILFLIGGLLILLGVSIKKTLVLKFDWLLIYGGFISLLYLLGFIYAVDSGMQLYGLFQGLYILVAGLVLMNAREGLIKQLGVYFVWSVALLGLLSILSFLTQDGLNLTYVINQRLAGPLQYANTSALLFIVAAMITFREVANKHLPYKYANLVLPFFIIPLVLTMSRASLAIGLVMGLILIILIRPKKSLLISLIISILVALVALKVLGDDVTAKRLGESMSQASEWQTRLLYYKDSVRMILSHPWGLGHLGYYYLQRAYQTGSMYHVKYVHSSLIQYGLDLGIPGLLAFGTFGLYGSLIRKNTWTNRIIMMTILGHSLMDLDLQFPYLWLVLIYLMTPIGPLGQERVKSVEATHKYSVLGQKPKKGSAQAKDFWRLSPKGWLMSSLCISILLVLLYMRLVIFRIDQEDYVGALTLYPYETEAAKAVLSPKQIRPDTVTLAYSVRARNPYIMQAQEVLKVHAIQEGDYREAIDLSASMVAIAPLHIKQYEQYAQTLMIGAKAASTQGDFGAARSFISIILEMPENLDKLAKDTNTDYNVMHKPELKMTETLWRYYEEALAMDKVLEMP